MYSKGSSAPHYCSGLSPRMAVPGGPNFKGAGLPLGPFAHEHALAKKKLDAVQSVESWWKTFLGQTPLWMRTAYNWNKPTPEQKEILKNAKKIMLSYAAAMAKNTQATYQHGSGDVHLHLHRPSSDEEKLASGFSKAPYWSAFVAGQQFVEINRTSSCPLDFKGLSTAMPGVQTDIKNVCQIVCDLRGWTEMGDHLVEKAMAKAKEQRAQMRRNMDVDISCLDVPSPA